MYHFFSINKLKNKYLIFLLFMFFFFLSYAQVKESNSIIIKKNSLKKITDSNKRASVFLTLSEVYFKQEVFDSCLVYAQKAIKLSDNDKSTAFANIYIGKSNIAIRNYKVGKNALEKALPYLEKTNNEKLPEIYSRIGNVYVSLNMLDEAIVKLNAAEKIAKESDKINIYIDFARFYFATREYEKIIEYLNKVTSLSLRNGNKTGLAGAYFYFALPNTERGEFEKSISYYLLAEDLYRELKSNINVANIQNNIAENYAALDSIDKAKHYYNEALMISKTNNFSKLTSIISSNMAKQNILQGVNISQSIEELTSINNNKYPIEIKGLICENYYYLAIGFLKKEDTLKAMNSLKKGITISKEENFSSLNEKNLSLLAKINFSKKNFIQAYLNAQDIIAYKEEIYNKEKNEEIELLRTKFDINTKEQELLFINEQQKKKNYIYIFRITINNNNSFAL